MFITQTNCVFILIVSTLPLLCEGDVLTSDFGFLNNKTIIGNMIGVKSYCHVTDNGVIWDNEEMCTILIDIWGTELFKCCHNDVYVKKDSKDCSSSDTNKRDYTTTFSSEDDSGPTRNKHTDRYVPVINGNQIALGVDGSFITRTNQQKFTNQQIQVKNSICKKLNKPVIKLKCDEGFTEERKIIAKRQIAGLLKGNLFEQKISISRSQSIKTADSSSINVVIGLSNEASVMGGIKNEVAELSANLKSTMSSSTTTLNTATLETGISSQETFEQSFKFSCDIDHCYILLIKIQVCKSQEIAKCTFVDPLLDYANVKPTGGKIIYCSTSESIVNAEKDDVAIKDNEDMNLFVFLEPIKNDKFIDNKNKINVAFIELLNKSNVYNVSIF
jgi:hypothetical protein